MMVCIMLFLLRVCLGACSSPATEVVEIGWIQVQRDPHHYVNLDTTSTGLVLGKTREGFKFLISPLQHGAYGLLATQSLSHVVRMTGSAHTSDSTSRAISVVPMPSGVAAGSPMPAIPNQDLYLFSINRKGEWFEIHSKQQNGSYVLTVRGLSAPNNDIAASVDAAAESQRWTFKSQQSTAKVIKFASQSTSAVTPPNAERIDFIIPSKQFVSDASPDIIDGKWVATNYGRDGAITAGAQDPAFPGDSTKKAYKITKDRTPPHQKDHKEFSRCFTRLSDLLHIPPNDIRTLLTSTYIYSLSPAPEMRYEQGSHMRCSFKIYIESWQGVRSKIQTIFAEWHGMPDKLLFKVPSQASTPARPLYKLESPKSLADAASMWSTYQFYNGISTANHMSTTTPEFPQYRYVEQGGFPHSP